MQKQFPAGGGRIDIFLEAFKTDILLIKKMNELNQMPKRPSEPVKLPNDHSVTRAHVF